MSFEELKEKAKEHGVKIGWTTKGLYKQVADAIVDGETVVAVAEGFASANRAPIVVTESRVYLAQYQTVLGGVDIVTINRQRIEGVGTSGGAVKRLLIETAGGSYTVEKMSPMDAQRIAQILS